MGASAANQACNRGDMGMGNGMGMGMGLEMGMAGSAGGPMVKQNR